MKEKSFDESWKELELLVNAIEDESLSLDELAKKVKLARQLIKSCESKLRNIEASLAEE